MYQEYAGPATARQCPENFAVERESIPPIGTKAWCQDHPRLGVRRAQKKEPQAIRLGLPGICCLI
jgi:hypothetical protein